jgi:hypothetical protein
MTWSNNAVKITAPRAAEYAQGVLACVDCLQYWCLPSSVKVSHTGKRQYCYHAASSQPASTPWAGTLQRAVLLACQPGMSANATYTRAVGTQANSMAGPTGVHCTPLAAVTVAEFFLLTCIGDGPLCRWSRVRIADGAKAGMGHSATSMTAKDWGSALCLWNLHQAAVVKQVVKSTPKLSKSI